MTYQQLQDLKTFLQANYPNDSPAQILEALQAVVPLPDNLTKAELTTFYAYNPEAELRLREFVSTPPPPESPALAVWGIANMALRVLTIPDVEFIAPDIAGGAIQGLYAAQLITDSEKTALEALCRHSTTVGGQTLGYVPTLEQIEQALSLT